MVRRTAQDWVAALNHAGQLASALAQEFDRIEAHDAKLALDGENRTVGIVAHDGTTVPFGPAHGLRALVVGDSITAQAEVTLSLASPYVVDNGDGTMTVTRNGHAVAPGYPFRVVGPQASTNLMAGEVLAVTDDNNFTATIQGVTHGVTSPSTGTVIFPLRRSARGWLTWLEVLRGELFRSTWCAVPGAATSDLLSLVLSTTAGPHDVAFVCAGMNDIYSDGDALATIQANAALLLAAVAARADRLYVLSVPPRNSADASWSAGKQTIHTGFNRWLYEQCLANGWHWISTARAVANGASYMNAAADEPDPAEAFMFDNTHPSSVGAYAIAKLVNALLPSPLGVTGWKPAHADELGADAGNIITDGSFATDAGGVATGWTVSDTSTNMSVTPTCEARTVAADGDALGKNQLLTINYGTASGTASTRFRKNNIHASLTAGQWVSFRVHFSVADAAGLLGIELAIFGTLASGRFWQVYGMNRDSNADPHTDTPIAGVLQTPPAQIPEDLNDVDIWVRPYISSAQSGDLVLKLWHPELRMWAAE